MRYALFFVVRHHHFRGGSVSSSHLSTCSPSPFPASTCPPSCLRRSSGILRLSKSTADASPAPLRKRDQACSDELLEYRIRRRVPGLNETGGVPDRLPSCCPQAHSAAGDMERAGPVGSDWGSLPIVSSAGLFCGSAMSSSTCNLLTAASR